MAAGNGLRPGCERGSASCVARERIVRAMTVCAGTPFHGLGARNSASGRAASHRAPGARHELSPSLDVFVAVRSPGRGACQLSEAFVVNDADVAWARRVANAEVVTLPPHRPALHAPASGATRHAQDCAPHFLCRYWQRSVTMPWGRPQAERIVAMS